MTIILINLIVGSVALIAGIINQDNMLVTLGSMNLILARIEQMEKK